MSEYDAVENIFKDAALPHFASGITSFLNFAGLASAVGIGELDDPESTKMKLEIKSCYDELGRAEKGGDQVIKSQTDQGIQLAVDLTAAKVEMAKLQDELWIKKDRLITEDNRRQEVRDKLQDGRSGLKHAENTLNSAKVTMGEKVTGRDVGIGLILLVPCVGIPMTMDCRKELKNAKEMMDKANKEKNELSGSIIELETDLSKLNEQIPNLSKEIERLKDNLAKKEQDVQKLQKTCAGMAELRKKLRCCQQHLEDLHGSVEVLHKSSKILCNLEDVMSIVKEIFHIILKQNSNNELLNYDSQVQKVLKELKVLQRNMKLK